jgi:hypothetical protein
MKRSKQPMFLCEPFGERQWRFWCPFCRRYHYHGAIAGGRAPHCIDNDSPLRKTGYAIKLDPSARISRKAAHSFSCSD